KELGFDDLSVVDLDVRPVGDVELEDLDVLAFALPVVLVVERHTQIGLSRAYARFFEQLANGGVTPRLPAMDVPAGERGVAHVTVSNEEDLAVVPDRDERAVDLGAKHRPVHAHHLVCAPICHPIEPIDHHDLAYPNSSLNCPTMTSHFRSTSFLKAMTIRR